MVELKGVDVATVFGGSGLGAEVDVRNTLGQGLDVRFFWKTIRHHLASSSISLDDAKYSAMNDPPFLFQVICSNQVTGAADYLEPALLCQLSAARVAIHG